MGGTLRDAVVAMNYERKEGPMNHERREGPMKDYTLTRGRHAYPADGRCAMEWVAYIAGEPHSDHPACVDPVLGEFGRAWNDALDDDTRQRLRPYLARMIGTANDGRSLERSRMCLDWLARTHTPAWLELAGLTEHARALRGLGPIASPVALNAAAGAAGDAAWDAVGAAAAGDAVGAAAARDAAGAAARAAARAAAGDAARDAAWAAAGDAAWNAANAAWNAAWAAAGDAAWIAAWDAAGNAARDAAWDAAGNAARDALAATVKALQASAFDLLDRMLPGEVLEFPAPVAERAAEVCSRA
jgi:hypothetical protein